MNDFVSSEQRPYKFRMGKIIASSLSGFIAGIIGGGVVVYVYLLSKVG